MKDAFNGLRTEINEILSEAKDVLEQFELEIRETPKDGIFLQNLLFESLYFIFINFILLLYKYYLKYYLD